MKVLSLSFWRYALDGSRADVDYGWPEWKWAMRLSYRSEVFGWVMRHIFGKVGRFACRWRGHPAGVYWFTSTGTEPDMRCKGCGEDLG